MIQGIIEILTEDIDVSEAVGRGVTSDRVRVYPVRVPQEEAKESDIEKYITVYKTPGEPTQSKDVVSTLDRDNFNVNCYAGNYDEAYELYELVRRALDLRQNIMTTDSGFVYQGIWFISDYDAYDDGSQKYVHVLSFSTHTTRAES